MQTGPRLNAAPLRCQIRLVMMLIVVAPFMIVVVMGGAVLLQVGMVAPFVPMMATVVIAIAVTQSDIAYIESDCDGGIGTGNGQCAAQDGKDGRGLEIHC